MLLRARSGRLLALVAATILATLASSPARSDPPPVWPQLPPGWGIPPPAGSAFQLPRLPPGFPPWPGGQQPAPGPAPAPAPAPGFPQLPGLAAPRVEFRRLADATFPRGGSVPRLTLLEGHRDNAWAAPSGAATVTSGGAAGSLLTAGRNLPLAFADGFDASFSPEGARVALVQARAPMTLLSIADGRVLWQRPEGRECAPRWASPTQLVFHDDAYEGQLWHLDTTTNVAIPLGPKINANRCWATANGSQYVLTEGSKIWLVNGATGAAEMLVENVGGVVGSPTGNRVCYTVGSIGSSDLFCQSLWPARLEHLLAGASLDGMSSIDQTGSRLLFQSQGKTMIADFASGTVFAAPAARIESDGSIALVGNGRTIAAGSSSGTFLYNTDAHTRTVVAGANGYSAKEVPGRPRSVIQGRETSNGWYDVYIMDVP